MAAILRPRDRVRPDQRGTKIVRAGRGYLGQKRRVDPIHSLRFLTSVRKTVTNLPSSPSSCQPLRRQAFTFSSESASAHEWCCRLPRPGGCSAEAGPTRSACRRCESRATASMGKKEKEAVPNLISHSPTLPVYSSTGDMLGKMTGEHSQVANSLLTSQPSSYPNPSPSSY